MTGGEMIPYFNLLEYAISKRQDGDREERAERKGRRIIRNRERRKNW